MGKNRSKRGGWDGHPLKSYVNPKSYTVGRNKVVNIIIITVVVVVVVFAYETVICYNYRYAVVGGDGGRLSGDPWPTRSVFLRIKTNRTHYAS